MSFGMNGTTRYLCPCCGYLAREQPPGTNAICPICFWEDSVPNDLARRYTSDRVQLLQAQRNFRAFGACGREWLDLVRPPTDFEARAPGWQPIDTLAGEQRQALLSRFGASATDLQRWLRTRIDDDMLRTIAQADYGYRADLNFIALRRFRDDGAPPIRSREGDWQSMEVLELIRWSEPSDPRWKPGETGVRGHLMRAFCCDLLLRAAAESQAAGCVHGESDTVIQLIASTLTLGRESIEPVLRLLCWRMLMFPAGADEGPYIATGMLLLAAVLYRGEADGSWLCQLTEWVLAEETCVRARLVEAGWDVYERWLFGLAYVTMKIEQWEQVARTDLLEPPEPHPAAAATALWELGALVVHL